MRDHVRARKLRGLGAIVLTGCLVGMQVPDSTGAVQDSTAIIDSIPAAAPAPPILFDSLPGPSAIVVVGGDSLWTVRQRLGPFSARERARTSALLIDSLLAAEDTSLAVTVRSGAGTSEVVAGGIVVAVVTAADAMAEATTHDTLAETWAQQLRVLEISRPRQTLTGFARGVLFTGIALVALLLVLWGLRRGFPRLYALVDHEKSRWIRSIRVQRLEIISAQRISETLTWVLKAIRFTLVLGALYFFVPLVLSFFPPTAGIADQLVQWVMAPLRQALRAVIAYVPNLFRIGVIVVVMYYVLRLVQMVFDGIRFGRIRLSGFYRDWARPTYQIVRFLLIVLTAVVLWPYLPMSDSPGFKGIAAFLGLLLSLGSASAIANIVGGVVLIYMRSFQVGDRVRVSETLGDVVEKGLLVTRIRTPKNVNVTIPNAMVLSHHLINYSRAAKDEGVILHTTVTLGYDVPWPKVHETLISAAAGVEGVLDTPEPFVLQTSLDDFYVAYELNVYTREPARMSAIYSDLHQAIQDACNGAGIEILSPHFRGLRDGNPLQVPEEYKDLDARVPAFKFSEAAGKTD